ncbi:MAG: hypothetical protein ACI825_000776 [Planctomycetota bacterium]|jgi:hypothetical protein|uniref:hypothetical protein n=1 Tax=Patiriisocius sp. Uisw_047 TaxID=3230969 RepID=UPI0039EC8B96
MSTLVELITVAVISFFGLSVEEPPEINADVIVIECCEVAPNASSDIFIVDHTLKKDNLVNLNLIQKSIKIEHNRTENTLL